MNDQRDDSQIEADNNEFEIAKQRKENQELLESVFKDQVEKQQLRNKLQQAEKNIKLLGDRKKDLDKQLTATTRT